MTQTDADEMPRIDNFLDPIRAAIEMVADGSAQRVTVYIPASAGLLPAARALARESGVVVVATDANEVGEELMVEPAPARTA